VLLHGLLRSFEESGLRRSGLGGVCWRTICSEISCRACELELNDCSRLRHANFLRAMWEPTRGIMRPRPVFHQIPSRAPNIGEHKMSTT
jgi:hypothetical protein